MLSSSLLGRRVRRSRVNTRWFYLSLYIDAIRTTKKRPVCLAFYVIVDVIEFGGTESESNPRPGT